MAAHEDLKREMEIKTASDRSFCFTFAVIFALLGLYPLLHGDKYIWQLLAACGVFFLVGLVFPKLFHPLNYLWTRLGLLLGKIVNPIVMGLIFFSVVTITGLIMRMLGKELLRLKWEPEKESYWNIRNPPGPKAESLPKQF